jgi:hypothetical protein
MDPNALGILLIVAGILVVCSALALPLTAAVRDRAAGR